MIKTLELHNFRNHKKTVLELAPGMTMFQGPTGAGKTSILDGFALLAVGANHWTDKAGKGADKMIRHGEASAKLKADIEGVGVIELGITNKKKSLTVPGSSSSQYAAKRSFLSEQLLKSNPETLGSLLDVRAVLHLPAKEQFELLLKAIRPTAIAPTPFLASAGIDQITDIQHLLDLIDHQKTEVLRDLRRDEKKLAAQADVEVNLPESPLKNTGMTEEDVQSRLKARRDEREEKIKRRQHLLGKIESDEQQRRRAVSQADTAEMDDEKTYQHRKEMAKKYAEQIKSARASITEREKELGQLHKQRGHLESVHATAEDTVDALSNPPENCTTCGQRWPSDKKKEFEQRLVKAQEQIKVAAESLEEKDGEIAKHTKGLEEARASRDQLQELLDAARDKIARYEAATSASEPAEAIAERIHAANQEVAALDITIESLNDKIAKGEKMQAAVDAYNNRLAAIEQGQQEHQSRLAELKRTQIPHVEHIISDLEGIRQKLLDDKVAELLEHVNEAMVAMEQPRVDYDVAAGWLMGGRPAGMMSGGQVHVCFEFAYRYGIAKMADFPVISCDQMAPVDAGVSKRLLKFAATCGMQVLMTWTTDTEKGQNLPESIYRYWVEPDGDGVAVVSRLRRAAA